MLNTKVKRLKITSQVRDELVNVYKNISFLNNSLKQDADFGTYSKKEYSAYISNTITLLQNLKKTVKTSTDISVDKSEIFNKTLSEKARLTSALEQAEAATEQLRQQLKMLDAKA
ncbi:MAG: hypothetical protein SPL83_04510 [Succinivibrio sp.]|nr:hypothetical protein [Succinivibrio sp.]